jgi:hypothetical protein
VTGDITHLPSYATFLTLPLDSPSVITTYTFIMGSQEAPDGQMPNLPIIKLDMTLAELYRTGSSRTANKRIGQILGGINSTTDIGLDVPRNAKYLYQDKAFNTTLDDSPATPGTEAVVRRELSMKYLSLIPQRDAFISGDTPVIFFRTGAGNKRLGHDIEEIESTIAVLDPAQRPRVVICASPDDIPIEAEGIDMLAYKLMLDGLGKYDLVIDPDTHWFLNSKAALADSGLPTPKCDVVDLTGYCVDALACCETCGRADEATGSKGYVIPTTCDGARGAWLAEQEERIYELLRKRPLPFVLKNQQTFGGAGTFMVRTEAEREAVVADFRDGVLRRLLSCVTEANTHLRPGALVFSDMVADPIGDYGVTFFVRGDGDPVFLAASEQMMSEGGGGTSWIGSSIDYDRQDELQRKFGRLVERTAAWLREKGYVGPAGADVLETAEPVENGGGNDELRRYHVVDLNVRTSGSLCLPLLRTHFTSRGLRCASSFSVSVRKSREGFMRDFREAFEQGRMCVLAWYQDPESRLSIGYVAVGAEDEAGLATAMKRVRDATEEIIF